MRIYQKIIPFCFLGFHLLQNTTLFAAEEPLFSRDLTEDLPFHHSQPTWGIQIHASPRALGHTVFQQDSTQPRALALLVEYQPAFIQRYGILDFGISLVSYPIQSNLITPKKFSFFAIGGQIRYQFRYWTEQFLVPILAYQIQEFKYHFLQGPSGWLLVHGPSMGLWFLLNTVDTSSATQLYLNIGIKRSYLIAEYGILSGKNHLLSIRGGSYFAGLRFEF